MNELGCVKLIKPFKKLKVGTKEYILLKYTENDFEVEFFDENNEKEKNKTKLCLNSKMIKL